MDRWQDQLKKSKTSPEALSSLFGIDPAPLFKVVSRYPMCITPYYLSLIRETGDPIWRQCVPDLEELNETRQLDDPLREEELSPVPGLIHRYPDRIVLLVSSSCAVYCRFCMRKRKVGCTQSASNTEDMGNAIEYLARHGEIRDVVLSGGDPLMLPDDVLENLLKRLRRIPHIEIIRIGTRMPVTLPARITHRLCRMLKKYHPIYFNTHFNHPWEITAESSEACARLADAGIPLGNQTVLLKGVNDNPMVMMELMQLLLKNRVKPYYLHQMDLVRGTGHFRTAVAAGLQILESLRGHTSGMACPHYVIDLEGGKGKVPLLPDNVKRIGKATLAIRSYNGGVVHYKDIPD